MNKLPSHVLAVAEMWFEVPLGYAMWNYHSMCSMNCMEGNYFTYAYYTNESHLILCHTEQPLHTAIQQAEKLGAGGA